LKKTVFQRRKEDGFSLQYCNISYFLLSSRVQETTWGSRNIFLEVEHALVESSTGSLVCLAALSRMKVLVHQTIRRKKIGSHELPSVFGGHSDTFQMATQTSVCGRFSMSCQLAGGRD
jgi:hypothetical protein